MRDTVPKLAALLLCAGLSSCESGKQNDIASQAKKVQAGIQEIMPGAVAVSAGGFAMSAKIDGRTWTADSMPPPDPAGRIIGYFKGESISLPYD